MAVLHPIAGTALPRRLGDVVFVHGLNGHWCTTWSHVGTDHELFWPGWLAQGDHAFGVWSLQYEAAPTLWRGHAMSISDRADNVLDRLTHSEVGQRPLFFVTHSMGGLLIKQLLRRASDKRSTGSGYGRILDACRGIIFLSTPHTGSDVATLTRYLNFVMRRSAAVADLERNAHYLCELNDWYRDNVAESSILNKVYYETIETPVVSILGRVVVRVRVVDRASADPKIAGLTPIPIDADHSSICHLNDQKDQIFVGCRQFILESIGLRSYTLLDGDASQSKAAAIPFHSAHEEEYQQVSVTTKSGERLTVTLENGHRIVDLLDLTRVLRDYLEGGRHGGS